MHSTKFKTMEMDEVLTESADDCYALHRDMSRCVDCKRCSRACSELQGMNVLENNPQEGGFPVVPTGYHLLKDTECISCGQCNVVCPTGAIVEQSHIPRVKQAMKAGKVMVMQTAPATRVAFGENFGREPGEITTGKMIACAKALGFQYVFDTNFGADMTIMEEGTELLERIKNNGPFPMFTSCCPGWVNMAEKCYPEILPNLSSCRSPHMMVGSTLKTYWAKKMNLKPEDIYVVSLMPCTAKKDEIERKNMWLDEKTPFVDAVLTTKELGDFCKQEGITNWDNMAEMPFDTPLGTSSGAGDIFGVSGGVMEAALRTAYQLQTGKPLEKIVVDEARGLDGTKRFSVDMNGKKINCAVVHSKFARELVENVKAGKEDLQFVEVMACPGGCISGGGQPHSNRADTIEKRMNAIYKIDAGKTLRRSMDNPEIQTLYKEFFEKPNSHKAHELLHTTYAPQYVRAREEKVEEPAEGGGEGGEGSDVGEDGVTILYGSETGTTAKAAKALQSKFKAAGISSAVIPMNKIDVESLPEKKKLVLMTCTYGAGEFPAMAQEFWENLSDESLDDDFLEGVEFGVFGLGSKAFKQFCEAAHQLDERMEELGAERVVDCGEGNEKDPQQYKTAFEPWSKEAVEAFK